MSAGGFIVGVREIKAASKGGPLPWRELVRRPLGEQAIEEMLKAESRYPADKYELSVFPADFVRR